MVQRTSRVRTGLVVLASALSVAFFPACLIGIAQETGVARKRPVFGGACKDCPWGAMAEIVRDAMRPDGYDVQVCYTCSGLDARRIVAGAKHGPARFDLLRRDIPVGFLRGVERPSRPSPARAR